MGLTTTIVLAGIVVGCLQLAAGVIIGRHFPLQRRPSRPGARPKGERLKRLARRLGLLVHRVADDVERHQARMAQVNRELSETEPADAVALEDAVLGALAQMIDSDARLQERLAQTEARLQQQAEQIQSQLSEARTDPLTELANRRAFRDELDRQIAQWQRKRAVFSLLMIDVDQFKALNDRYGHAAGDHALREIGELLKATLREMDLAARVGGEEFAVILPSTSLSEAGCAAQRVRQAIESHVFRFEQWEWRLTASVGLATVGTRDNPVSLIRRADEAMYASKRAGRNCAHFHDGETCRPIGREPNPAPEPTASCNGKRAADEAAGDRAQNTPPPPVTDNELQSACRDLRARLIEVIRGKKGNDDAAPSA